eukprot:TRINITY_DN11879_c0_g1_i4.p7 TRINITY_DN11879_c0_g1~~TRINITY_DN11879_c0_g1_i4.p7  ORF type:complete len:130 (-),score=13.17 TRINITY_DN11879_c0_g1_i4:2549-2938(-)
MAVNDEAVNQFRMNANFACASLDAEVALDTLHPLGNIQEHCVCAILSGSNASEGRSAANQASTNGNTSSESTNSHDEIEIKVSFEMRSLWKPEPFLGRILNVWTHNFSSEFYSKMAKLRHLAPDSGVES